MVKIGPDAAVDSLLDFEKIPDDPTVPDWAKPDPQRAEHQRQLQALNQKVQMATSEDEKTKLAEERRQFQQQFQRDTNLDLLAMRANWLERMTGGPRPFQEKLTLFWHGHFATSSVKVREPYFMWRQIQTFREKGTGNWLDLLQAVATDPAMLLWLDQAQSRREHPNENFARECMELFTLGEGHYTEKDVTEAARAMTGWSLDRDTESYRYRPFFHDSGLKTVFGQTGPLTGNDVLQMIVAQPQSRRFITGKLWKFFATDALDPDLNDAMADAFLAGRLNFHPFLRTLFRSEEFYSAKVMGSQIKSPVQWLVSSSRMLERPLPPPAVSIEMIRTLGQDLLAPPNVKGWDGGLSWITTNTLLSRYNQAAVLVMGQGNLQATAGGAPGQGMLAQQANLMARFMRPINVNNIIAADERADHERLLAALEKRFLLTSFSEEHRQVLRDYIAGREVLRDDDIRHLVRLLLATPEFQVC